MSVRLFIYSICTCSKLGQQVSNRIVEEVEMEVSELHLFSSKTNGEGSLDGQLDLET